MKHLLVALIRIYQWTLSPFLMALGGPGTGCRFEPSCSEYCVEAVRAHGSLKGSFLAIRRLCRCHPWGGCGWDPVPETPPSGEPCRAASPSPRPL